MRAYVCVSVFIHEGYSIINVNFFLCQLVFFY